jgi:alkylated DNA repair dioxygenase AlkB
VSTVRFGVVSPSTSRAVVLHPGLFGADPRLPQGLSYKADLLTPAEEADLIARIAGLSFEPFEFRGYLGFRRVVSFGWRYDYMSQRLGAAPEPPEFLLALRERLAVFGRRPEAFSQVLVTEYAAGAGIGWHRDKPHFDEVAGVSLGGPCLFRFRRRAGAGWDRVSTPLEPRSAYLLSGAARGDWEHSIPPVDALRYSVTFRSRREASLAIPTAATY